MIFTLFVCLGAGIFAVQGLLAAMGKGAKLQLPALIASLVALVIGGIGSFLHLQHWERAFNGFGHLTSGITQELIGIVVFVAALLLYFIMMRRAKENKVPKWCGVMAIIVSLALVYVMGHSYNMAARPVWNTALLPLYYITNSAFFGALTMMVIAAITKMKDVSQTLLATWTLIAGCIQAVATAAYTAYFSLSAASFINGDYPFDPTQPTKVLTNPVTQLNSIVTGEHALLFWLGVVVVGLVIPLILAFVTRRTDTSQSTITLALGTCALVSAVAGALCLRVILYLLGFSVFVFF
jgi:anaerobic dimethyl sulfoxide reductase subunit C (anchor subunit)